MIASRMLVNIQKLMLHGANKVTLPDNLNWVPVFFMNVAAQSSLLTIHVNQLNEVGEIECGIRINVNLCCKEVPDQIAPVVSTFSDTIAVMGVAVQSRLEEHQAVWCTRNMHNLLRLTLNLNLELVHIQAFNQFLDRGEEVIVFVGHGSGS